MWKAQTSTGDGGQITLSSFPSSPSNKPSSDSYHNSDRDSGISSQHYYTLQHYPPNPQVPGSVPSNPHQPHHHQQQQQQQQQHYQNNYYYQQPLPPQNYSPGGSSGGQQAIPANQRTAEWLGRYVVPGSGSDAHSAPTTPNYRNGTHTGAFFQGNHVINGGAGGAPSQHRLSAHSYDSSGISSARHSYHSSSSSSIGSLDRLEESAYSSSLNVHQRYQAGLPDEEVLRAWLTDLHFEDYLILFLQAGYDMPTISRMTPEDLTAIGITKPAHRKRIKTELSRLHIHDGIPDFKPGDVREWLQLLSLEEYIPSLTAQGYLDIDSLADITWEDLEDIGVKKLGHQKKIMLALDRLKKIATSGVNNDRRGSGDILEPPSSYPSLQYTDTDPPASPSMPHHSHMTEDVVITCPRRSPSRENMHLSGMNELRTFQQRRSPDKDEADVVHLRQKNSYQPDVVAIHVNRAQNVRMSSTSGDSAYESEGGGGGSSNSSHYSSFQAPDHITSSSSQNSSQLSPTYESNHENGCQRDAVSVPKRPSAKVSPRPKPKPMAMIVAKRASREMPADLKSCQYQESQEPALYTSNTLPRKSSSSKTHLEHIYDQPAEMSHLQPSPKHSTFGHVTQNSAPSSPAHTSTNEGHFGMPSPSGKAKRPPPPPPKRTNSMKTQDLLRTLSERCKSADVSASLPASHPASSLAITSSFSSALCASQDQSSSSAIYSNSAAMRDSCTGPLQSQPPPQTTSQPAPPMYTLPELDNPLGEVIERLERGKASNSPTSTAPAIPPKPGRKQAKLGDWQDEASSGEESDSSSSSATLMRLRPINKSVLNPSCTSLDSTTSSASTDSNNLPFANENVGTIKQRSAVAKTSILADGEAGDGVDDDRDLDASLFEEETDTMKRNPKASSRGKSISSSTMSTSTASSQPASVTDFTPQPRETKGSDSDVLNDIDSMLQDLTSELDAMLDSDLL